MHIIAGKYKGLGLEYDSKYIRPTTSKVRGAFFNIMSDKIVGADFLELFCGSGAMAIEALSRDAKSAIAIDLHLETAQKNKHKFKLDNLQLVRTSAEQFIKKNEGLKLFDIVYLDPPYRYLKQNELLFYLSKFAILKEDGVLAFESESAIEKIEGLKQVKICEYGQSKLSFFKIL